LKGLYFLQIPKSIRSFGRKVAMNGIGRGLKEVSINALGAIILLLILIGIRHIFIGCEEGRESRKNRNADRLAKRLKTDIDFRSLLILEDQLGKPDREGDCFDPSSSTKVTNCRDYAWDEIVSVWVAGGYTGGMVVQAKIYNFQALCGQREEIWTSRTACGLPVSIDGNSVITYWNPAYTTHY
jgi:hypothetical protein